MTTQEFMKSIEFETMMNKIKGYSKGFTFELPYYKMTKAQRKGMDIVIVNAKKQHLLESIQFNLDLQGNITSERLVRI